MLNQLIAKKWFVIGFGFAGFALAGLMVVESSAFAANEDNILEEEPAAATARHVNPPAAANTAENEDWWVPSEKGGLGDRGKIMIGGFGGVQFNSYALSGIGFTSSLSGSAGEIYGGEVRYKAMSGFYSLDGSFAQSSIKNNNVTAVSPSSITTKRSQTYVDVTLYPIPRNENLGFMAGYAFTDRSATNTSPNEVISNYSASGPLMGLRYTSRLSPRVLFDSKFDLYFPSHYEETSAGITGFRNTAYGGDLVVGAFYALSSNFSVGLNANLHMESTTFNGTGSRGTTDGSEKDWSYGVPVELRVIF